MPAADAIAPVHVIDDTAAAATLLSPIRLRILEALQEEGSAAQVARSLGLPRQKVSYHLRALEKAGLVRPVAERRRGNCTERIVRATATSYLVGPPALGALGTDPARFRDRFSSAYLIALAARAIRELAALRVRAERAGKQLPTLGLETEVRFASPAAQKAFADELAQALGALAAKYHDQEAPAGRRFRFFVAGHPAAGETGSAP